MTELKHRCGFVTAMVLSLALTAAARAAATATQGVLAEGTKWATPYHVIESGEPGPTVMVVGGVHGNEPAGARAARQVMSWPVLKGRLIVVPRVNQPGLDASTRYLPGVEREQRDLNRNFPRGEGEDAGRAEGGADAVVPGPGGPGLGAKEAGVKGELAGALWGLATRERPEWVIDLHEGYDFHIANSKSVGASIIHFSSPRMNELVDAMLEEVNATVADPKRRLVPLRRGGPVNGSFARAAGLRLGAEAMILETCYKDQRLPVRARQHRVMVHHVLRHLGMTDADAAAAHRLVSAHSEALRIALYDDGGVGGAGRQRLEAILQSRGAIVRRIDATDIAHGVLDQFDAAVFSGGSGSAQAKSLGEEGGRRVKRYVQDGGGYVGICAGAYLATANYSWSLGLLDAGTLHEGNQWRRGRGMVELELTAEGKRVLGELPAGFKVLYANGPVVGPAGREAITDYTPLARYRTELAENDTPAGLMVQTPAIFAGPFGDGRALAIGPHPEQTDGLAEMVWRAVRWSAQADAPVEQPCGGESPAAGESPARHRLAPDRPLP